MAYDQMINGLTEIENMLRENTRHRIEGFSMDEIADQVYTDVMQAGILMLRLESGKIDARSNALNPHLVNTFLTDVKMINH